MALLVLGALASQGCSPSCRMVCTKVLKCDADSERVAQDECVDQCDRQVSLYRQWQDDEKLKAFRQHRRCLYTSSCEDIEAGECYDELIFEFDQTSPIEGS